MPQLRAAPRRAPADPDIPTRTLVVEAMANQLIEVARVTRPEAFTDPVTTGTDDHR